MTKYEMKYLMGKPIKEWLKEDRKKSQPLQTPLNHNAPRKEDFIYVPSINLYVAKEKTMHGLNWIDTHKELAKEKGKRMPTPYEFTEFIKYLLKNPNGTKDASNNEIQLITKEILEKRDHWRAEHLDVYFEKRNNEMYILTKNKSIADKLDAFFRTDLEEYCEKKKIDELYFCGVYSGVCVYFSAAGAAMRGIQPYLVTDASSTEHLNWHKRNCDNFKTVLGPLITTKQLLRKISN